MYLYYEGERMKAFLKETSASNPDFKRAYKETLFCTSGAGT